MNQHLAIYLRLSLEDMDVRTNKIADESNSIKSQRLLVHNYIESHPKLSQYPVVEYVDDGYSGTNFDRPGVKRLIEQVKTGQIACIVVKDLSRFGRNYLEVGDYLEHIFPLLGVRFIAVNDRYDSNQHVGTTGGIDVAFRNLVAERYSQDLSEKIKSSRYIQMKKGKFVSHCPYGYMRHPTQKHQMVIDPQTAPIVKWIFRQAIEGKRSTEIASMLNERGIITPQAYKKWENPLIKNDMMWSHQAVLRILKDYKYTGAMVSFKCGNETVRAKAQKQYKPEDWVITEGCHEAIISHEDYQKANETIRKVRYNGRKKTSCADRIYYCGSCGRRLRKTFGNDEYFSCQTQLYQKEALCASIFWGKRELEKILIAAYRVQLQVMEQELQAQAAKGSANPLDACRRKQRETAQKLSSMEGGNLKLYEMYREGKISRDQFAEQKNKHKATQAALQEKLALLREEESRLLEQEASSRNRLQLLREKVQHIILTDEAIVPFVYDAIERVDIFPSKELKISWKHNDSIKTDE